MRGGVARAGALVLVMLPLVPVAVQAFAGRWPFGAALPLFWTLRGIDYLAAPGLRLIEALTNSLLIGVLVTIAAVAAGLPAGIALGRYRFRGRSLAVFVMLLPILVPQIAPTLGVYQTFIRLGLDDSIAGVVLVHLIPTVPYVSLVLASVFARRPDTAERAARTLGASPARAFLYVTVPQIAPALAVAALLAFLISWSQYILTVLIGGGTVLTLPMLLFSASSGSDPVVTAALTLVFILPAVVVMGLALRVVGTTTVTHVPAIESPR